MNRTLKTHAHHLVAADSFERTLITRCLLGHRQFINNGPLTQTEVIALGNEKQLPAKDPLRAQLFELVPGLQGVTGSRSACVFGMPLGDDDVVVYRAGGPELFYNARFFVRLIGAGDHSGAYGVGHALEKARGDASELEQT